MEILVFYLGIIFAQTLSVIPLISLLLFYYLRVSLAIVIYFLLAICWSFLHQWLVKTEGMPKEEVVSSATIRGKITSIPIISEGRIQFKFLLKEINHKAAKANVILSCYQNCPTFKYDETWQLGVKLKKIQAPGNPGMRNFKLNQNARHIEWSGYLKTNQWHLDSANKSRYSLLAFRDYLNKLIQASLVDSNKAGIVAALTIGMTNSIDKQTWELFRRTGTTHLMVISGTHIGLVAGFCYMLTRRLWSRYFLVNINYPAQKTAAIFGLITAIVYALLSGFAVPAQRAVFAYFFATFRFIWQRRFTGWQAWRYALLVILIIEPHAVLLPGFYLSFLAVALLIACSARFAHFYGWKKLLILQLACLIGLLPLTLYWFSYGAINGFFANVVAIPLVSYIITPLSLISVLLTPLLNVSFLFSLLEKSIGFLLNYLHIINKLSLINFDFSFNSSYQLIAFCLAIILFFFADKKLVLAAVILAITAFYPQHLKPKLGEYTVTVLDVGQGLSIVIQTKQHTLVYDTGMKFFQGSDMAELVIIPYLRHQGIKSIDKVVISHPDIDHRGGLVSLENSLKVKELVVDNPSFYHRGNNCHRYGDWDWDQVHFHFFPTRQLFRDKNNSSCVLQITNNQGKVLLTGDIEQLAENYLRLKYANSLQSDVLIVAHHGSKTSSTPAFLDAVAPQYALISTGFDNRFHFPHANTLSNLKTRQIEVFDTSNCGKIEWSPGQTPRCFRDVKNLTIK